MAYGLVVSDNGMGLCFHLGRLDPAVDDGLMDNEEGVMDAVPQERLLSRAAASRGGKVWTRGADASSLLDNNERPCGAASGQWLRLAPICN